MQFTDKLTLDGAIRRTADGYGVVSARVARGGNVQTYLGSEVGITDKDLVRVYRPASEVFKKDAIASYAGVPITVNHPKGGVSADTWKDLAVGEVGDDVLRDGEFVRVPMMLRDAKAIEAVEGGKRELSMGYSADITLADGVTPTGEAFDVIMSDFKMNHVAIVHAARGGSELRIGDDAGSLHWGAAPISTPIADERKAPMADNLRTVVVDGLSVSTTDQGAQAIEKLQNDKRAVEAQLADAEKAHKDAIAAKDAELAKKDAAIDAEKAKVLSDADLDKRVQDRAALVTVAGVIAKDVKTAGLSDADIRKAVVAAKLGDDAVKDKTPAYIDARFDILAEDSAKGTDPVRDALLAGVKTNDGDNATVTDAYAKMVADMQSAHRPAVTN
ncbi:DUF2213 domain-containing protein [Hoeflea sp. G2-23]|uniref:DUF2213 domain-containing protein n=1 Tax=Hoeflea algicola TaxID=2983763 RepID=A0ABT3ZGR8_9HYPH|nr:DUF2213 domain-containing protein [Hoeflea algicola]MCY0150893.1 DUF2213 domain-containing protein [Hoeflea algicola]